MGDQNSRCMGLARKHAKEVSPIGNNLVDFILSFPRTDLCRKKKTLMTDLVAAFRNVHNVNDILYYTMFLPVCTGTVDL